jgi:DnaJ family protein C protein 28
MSSIDELIRKAMEEGKFDDLPGKGKPLRLDDNPHEDPEWSLAYHVLRNSGFSLPWIEARQAIENDLAAARQALQRTWQWREAALQRSQTQEQVETEWQRAVQTFGEAVVALNKRIQEYNLQAPADPFQLQRLVMARELQAITNPAASSE